MEIPKDDSMKKLVSVPVFCALTLFAQEKPTKASAPNAGNGGAKIGFHAPSPAFTKLENVVAQDITQKQMELQQEINDFMAEVRTAHPGFFFSNGSLEPIPAPPKAADKPAAKEEKK